MRDFTVQTYISLCSALKEENYSFITFLEYCKGEVTDRFVIMRHDVDRSPLDALRIANCEKDLDVRSSFYFRMTGYNNADQSVGT